MAAAGGTRRGALLALLSLLSLLALLALRAGHGGEGRAGSPRLPPGLLEELRQRQRDLRRLAAAAEGGQAEGAGLGCGDLRGATGGGVLGSGFTKVVQRAALPGGGGAVALKSVHGAGREVRQCEQRYGAPAGCRRLAAYKLLKEVALLQRLRHPGIVQVRRGDPRLSPPSLLFSPRPSPPSPSPPAARSLPRQRRRSRGRGHGRAGAGSSPGDDPAAADPLGGEVQGKGAAGCVWEARLSGCHAGAPFALADWLGPHPELCHSLSPEQC